MSDTETAPRSSKLKWIAATIAAAPMLALLVVLVVGSALPAEHEASRTVVLPRSPEKVWAIITDYPNQTTWRRELKQVVRMDDEDGQQVWREVYDKGERVDLVTIEAIAPRKLVRRIKDDGGPFSGRWVFELESDPEGCRLTLTEHGKINNPFFRFVAKYFIGHTATMDLYLRQLETRTQQAE